MPTTRVRLVSFKRIFVPAGHTVTVTLPIIRPTALAVVGDSASNDVYTDARQVEAGNLVLSIGGGQPDFAQTRGAGKVLTATLPIVGSTVPLANCNE